MERIELSAPLRATVQNCLSKPFDNTPSTIKEGLLAGCHVANKADNVITHNPLYLYKTVKKLPEIIVWVHMI